MAFHVNKVAEKVPVVDIRKCWPPCYLPSYLENKTINLQPRSRRKCQGFSRKKKPEKLRVELLYCVSGEIRLAMLAVVLLVSTDV